ncbi:DUF7674 family protein [Granulicella paludicola]|jgi:hypothetical protein|uniref:DUF7674 family protein n=1 Tax=Granulicella paludicola TaxID=474951 RepID=UPI0021E08CF4|nr:hypothetical protein [Granulicella paludicola]
MQTVIRYENVVKEMLIQLPALIIFDEEQHLGMIEDNLDLAYVIFGSLLVPFLESAIARGDKETLRQGCNFLEQISADSRQDLALENLIGVEIGEWLEFVCGESVIASLLGEETKRVCNYVPGLATQRRMLKGLPC